MTKIHHSVSDWDFLYIPTWAPFSRWDLYNGFFVSPPTSLRFRASALDPDFYALSNLPQTQDLKAGRFITWHQAISPGVFNAYLHIGVTGPGDPGIKNVMPVSYGSFDKHRWDWWQGYDLQNQPATLVNRYLWSDPDWLDMGISFHPPMSGAVNRVGIGENGGGIAGFKYFDNTEIWIPA